MFPLLALSDVAFEQTRREQMSRPRRNGGSSYQPPRRLIGDLSTGRVLLSPSFGGLRLARTADEEEVAAPVGASSAAADR